MNRRELVAAAILATLKEWELPVNEMVLFQGIRPRPELAPDVLLSEFDEAKGLCERSKWITGIRTGVHGVRWSITDAGRAELAR